MTGRNGNRRLSKDERALWKTVTKAIKPIRAPALGIDELEPDDAPALPPRLKARAAKSVPIVPRVERPVPPPLVPLERRMKQRVARGKQTIDAKLDLHGMTQDEAHTALARFLRDASAREAKVVLVITGKGVRGDGVLRRQVPQWLGLPEFRSLVIGFEQATIKHGGEGALYVRVRRSR